MNLARQLGFTLVVIACCCIWSASPTRAQSQPAPNGRETTRRGIEQYNSGDNAGAIKTLRVAVKQDKEDADAWYYLGRAFYRQGKTKDARKAFEKTVMLRPRDPDALTGLAYTWLLSNKVFEAEREAERALLINDQNSEAHYILGSVHLRTGRFSDALKSATEALRLKPDLAPALLVKSQTLINMYASDPPLGKKSSLNVELSDRGYSKLKEAAEALERYLQLKPNTTNAKEWREQLVTLRIYIQLAEKSVDQSGEKIYNGSELRADPTATRARILSKPTPGYTDAARSAMASGMVALQMVLAADGRVKHILVLTALSDGLTQEAIKAARNIKFIPATKGGLPVSQFIRVEYNFNIY